MRWIAHAGVASLLQLDQQTERESTERVRPSDVIVRSRSVFLCECKCAPVVLAVVSVVRAQQPDALPPPGAERATTTAPSPHEEAPYLQRHHQQVSRSRGPVFAPYEMRPLAQRKEDSPLCLFHPLRVWRAEQTSADSTAPPRYYYSCLVSLQVPFVERCYQVVEVGRERVHGWRLCADRLRVAKEAAAQLYAQEGLHYWIDSQPQG